MPPICLVKLTIIRTTHTNHLPITKPGIINQRDAHAVIPTADIARKLSSFPAPAMDAAPPPEFLLEAFADPRSVREVVKAILHTIFFNRFFPSLTPRTRDVLDLTLPYVDDDELETMIDARATALERQLDASSSDGARGQIDVQFFEKRRRKAWLSRGDEEVCWECWTIKVTVAHPRTESGKLPFSEMTLNCQNKISFLTYAQNEQRCAELWSRRCWPQP